MTNFLEKLDEKWIDVKCMVLDIIDYQEAELKKEDFIKYMKIDIQKLTEKLDKL